ncbi:MAG: NADH-quinone oxidoreductase subunit NuoE [Chloroflexi bacterium]|jgi:NADH:ubiquinone oxidoreductase subunit E|nr:NADH-quinone oxidoreductase subunit NuoE [Chloroflexota bacterium]
MDNANNQQKSTYEHPGAIQEIRDIVLETGQSKDALIAVLKKVADRFGYISNAAVQEISRQTSISAGDIFSVATFYRMLPTTQRGRHVIEFCESLPCHVVGGRELYRALVEQLGVQPGETSADGRFTLLTTSCLGVCEVGPVLSIDNNIHGNLSAETLPEILQKYE